MVVQRQLFALRVLGGEAVSLVEAACVVVALVYQRDTQGRITSQNAIRGISGEKSSQSEIQHPQPGRGSIELRVEVVQQLGNMSRLGD